MNIIVNRNITVLKPRLRAAKLKHWLEHEISLKFPSNPNVCNDIRIIIRP
jgi:hypothetical protein